MESIYIDDTNGVNTEMILAASLIRAAYNAEVVNSYLDTTSIKISSKAIKIRYQGTINTKHPAETLYDMLVEIGELVANDELNQLIISSLNTDKLEPGTTLGMIDRILKTSNDLDSKIVFGNMTNILTGFILCNQHDTQMKKLTK